MPGPPSVPFNPKQLVDLIDSFPLPAFCRINGTMQALKRIINVYKSQSFFQTTCFFGRLYYACFAKMNPRMSPIAENPFDVTTNDESSFISDTTSESVPSETSEDRDFVVSDTEPLSWMSSSLSGSDLSHDHPRRARAIDGMSEVSSLLYPNTRKPC